jgi:hypothetical protein
VIRELRQDPTTSRAIVALGGRRRAEATRRGDHNEVHPAELAKVHRRSIRVIDSPDGLRWHFSGGAQWHRPFSRRRYGRCVIPAETEWAVQALRRSSDRIAGSLAPLFEDEDESLAVPLEDKKWPAALFGATTEALMWVVVLDDWYSRDHSDRYDQEKASMKSLLLGLRWARNRTLHDFALLTGFLQRDFFGPDRWPHPGWQYREVLPASDPRFDRGAAQYDGRVAGRALLAPIMEVAKWFEGWVQVELGRSPSEGWP